MKSPGLTANVGGKNKTLYMPTVKSIEEKTRENLKKTLGGRGNFTLITWLTLLILGFEMCRYKT